MVQYVRELFETADSSIDVYLYRKVLGNAVLDSYELDDDDEDDDDDDEGTEPSAMARLKAQCKQAAGLSFPPAGARSASDRLLQNM